MGDLSNELLNDFLSLAMFTLWALFTTLLPRCCCSVMLTAHDGRIMAQLTRRSLRGTFEFRFQVTSTPAKAGAEGWQ
jgi:uncharacterized protein (DUF2062 family)